MPPSSVKPAVWAAVAVFLLFACTLQGFFSYGLIRHILYPESIYRSPIDPADTSPVVESIDHKTYPELKGISPGDRILQVNGQPYTSHRSLGDQMDTDTGHGELTMTVEHQGRVLPPVTVRLKSGPPPSWRNSCLNLALGVLLPWFSVLLAATVLILKPGDRLAWIFAFLVVSFVYMLAQASFFGLPGWLGISLAVYFSVMRYSWPIWLALFGIYFPDRHPIDRRWPWAKWVLLGPLAVTVVLSTIWRVAIDESVSMAGRLGWIGRLGDPWDTILATAAAGLFFALLGHRRFTEKSPDARRRLRLLLYGANVSFLPLLALFVGVPLAMTLLKRSGSFSTDDLWVTLLLLFTIPVFPLTLGYLVVVHKALDVRVFLRQGLQYALATRSVAVLQLAATLAAVSFAAFATEGASMVRRITAIALAIAFVLGIRRTASALRTWIDRRFFRDAYQTEHVLTDLADTVRTIVGTEPLLETVTQRIADTLHVSRVAVLLGDGTHGFRPAYALGFAATPTAMLPLTAVSVREMTRAAGPVRVYLDDPSSWVNRPTGPGEEERRHLEDLDAQLLLPLSVKDRILGVLSLGPKRSEEPYSGSDLRLLSGVAGQAGLALENSRLAEVIAREAASRERLNREMEIARDVQRRFFPQRKPEIPGLDYAGFCLPAESVGGDFYDFRRLDDGRLAVALGDVAGKGAPAALLMASLQASLRAQVSGNGFSGLDSMITRLNALVCEITPASRFSTLFYAQYDPNSRQLRYVNAGHNPPAIVRDGQLIHLRPCGPAIGLGRATLYVERSLTLEPRDLLVAFTDGVTEAMNTLREDFGDQRLEAVLRMCGEQDSEAAAVIAAVREAVERHTAGAMQHDDLTLVVLRVR